MKLPDLSWLPNIHPLLVHLPIGIIILATGSMILMLVLKQERLFRNSLQVLLVGTATLVVTYISGRYAVNTVMVPADANSILSNHSDFAFRLLIFYLILSSLIVLFIRKKTETKLVPALTVCFLSVIGMAGLGLTADYGGRLVYQFGVGTVTGNLDDERQAATGDRPEFSLDESGSWSWHPGDNAAEVLRNNFTWINGSPDSVDIETSGENGGFVFIKTPDPYFISAGIPLDDVQIDMEVSFDDFEGEFMIVHHLINDNKYDFLRLDDGEMILGRQTNSAGKILDRSPVDYSGPVRIRVVGSKSHFRGYLNEQLITHGHLSPLTPGKAGIMVDGQGTLQIFNMVVQSLKE